MIHSLPKGRFGDQDAATEAAIEKARTYLLERGAREPGEPHFDESQLVSTSTGDVREDVNNALDADSFVVDQTEVL